MDNSAYRHVPRYMTQDDVKEGKGIAPYQTLVEPNIFVAPTAPVYKYREEEHFNEVLDMIKKTYSGHYAAGNIQTLDIWQSLGSAETSCRDTAIKYLCRFGKKDGRNQTDLKKAVHYVLLLMHFSRLNDLLAKSK